MSANLGATQVATGQTQKEQAINDAVGRMDAAMTEVLTVNMGATDTATLTATQFRTANLFKLEDDGIDAAGILNVPTSVKRGFFAVQNNTGENMTIRISGQVATPPMVPTGKLVGLHCDGSNVRAIDEIADYATTAEVASAISDALEALPPVAYDFGFAFGDTPASSAILGRVRIGRDIDTDLDFAGSFGGVGTNPTSTFIIDVHVNGVSVATITVSTSGVVTWDSGASPLAFDAGDEVTFLGPVVADATVAGGSFVIVARIA